MRFQRPSHGTVVAYVALFVAIGGSAYAVTKVGSADVRNDSLKSADLRDGTGVKGRDVQDESLRGKDLRESTVDASGFTAMARGTGGCDPSTEAHVVCAQTTIDLPRTARVMAIGSGGFFSQGGPASSTCEVDFDGVFAGGVAPGEVASDNTDGGAAEAFTTTGLSSVLPAGPHSVTLECNQVVGDARISAPAVAAIALGEEP